MRLKSDSIMRREDRTFFLTESGIKEKDNHEIKEKLPLFVCWFDCRPSLVYKQKGKNWQKMRGNMIEAMTE